jgi:lysophospholipase L1-like esterase
LKKTLLIAGSLAAALALCELSLFLVGQRLYPYPWPVKIDAEKAASEIWCLGDSNTQGAGAPIGKSYPAQLEALLRRADNHWKVLNLGMGGSNSSIQVKHLLKALEHGTPKVLFYMGGANNAWNLADMDKRLLLRSHGPSGILLSLLQKLRTFKFLFNYLLPKTVMALRDESKKKEEEKKDEFPLYESTDLHFLLGTGREQVVREYLSAKSPLSWNERLLLGGAFFIAGEYSQAEKHWQGRLPSGIPEQLPVDSRLLRAEARRMAEEQPSPESLAFYANWRPPRPDNVLETDLYWLGHGWLLLSAGRLEEAKAKFSLVAEPRPERMPWRFLALEGLGWVELQAGRLDAAERLLSQASSHKVYDEKEVPLAAILGLAWIAKSKNQLPTTRRLVSSALLFYQGRERERFPAQVRQLERLVSGRERTLPRDSLLHHVPFYRVFELQGDNAIAHTLPHDLKRLEDLSRQKGFELVILGYPGNRVATRALRRFADNRGLPFIDTAAVLGDMRANGLLADDQVHPNERGYGKIAEMVFERLRKLGLLSP